jgi:hypothetical protein
MKSVCLAILFAFSMAAIATEPRPESSIKRIPFDYKPFAGKFYGEMLSHDSKPYPVYLETFRTTKIYPSSGEVIEVELLYGVLSSASKDQNGNVIVSHNLVTFTSSSFETDSKTVTLSGEFNGYIYLIRMNINEDHLTVRYFAPSLVADITMDRLP